jgi:putative ATP-dependent endonuclease of the OLD family
MPEKATSSVRYISFWETAYPTRQGLVESDFYNNDKDREIHIQVWFYENEHRIKTIWASCPPDDRMQVCCEYFNYDKAYPLRGDLRDKFALVYIDASRNFDNVFGISRWSLFGRIIRHLDDDFKSTVPIDKRKEVVSHLGTAQGILKTPLYRKFEQEMTDALHKQLRRTTHDIRFDFRTFDPLNFYKNLQPILIEDNIDKNPSEAGSGMRNLIVMALFRAYAQTFKGDAIIAIEEPEIYLHPHAQRSLCKLFEELVLSGNQILYSTHSATFIDVARTDRIVLVERCKDDEGEVCTRTRAFSQEALLEARRVLYPGIEISLEGVRERYRNLCSSEHAEAFFAQAILLVEGPSERGAIPIYAAQRGFDLDAHGVSVVSANGKHNLDQLFQLYTAHGIPVYIVFDNDEGGEPKDIHHNRILTRMLGLPEQEMPAPVVSDRYAVIGKTYERAIEADLNAMQPGLYGDLKAEAEAYLGKVGKPLIARYMARNLTRRGIVPQTVSELIDALKRMVTLDAEETP